MDFDAQGNPIPVREIIRSDEFTDFLTSLSASLQVKAERAVTYLECEKVTNVKVVKKIDNTVFYELRVSADNEYRVAIFAIDHSNIIEARKAVLLNGFVKKSNKDYRKAVSIAEKLLTKYEL